ncbi:cell division protein FtsQ/DivIB, partial [Kocuria tytonicola]|uniref:cell division protein FtsQ/DivIB n=1 Tax=Kocuria tytonicola TaxID=2055946 RepID=UPI0030B8047E
ALRARSAPPSQPAVAGDPGDPQDLDDAAFVVDRGPLPPDDAAVPPRGSGSSAVSADDLDALTRAAAARRPGHGSGAGEDARPAVQVNDPSKVSRVDTGQLEAVPEAGGRFSSWRARRRAARVEDLDGGAGDLGPEEGKQRDGARSTVVPFPPSPARRRRRTRLLTAALSLLVLLVLLVAVFFSPLFATRTIDVQGATLTNPQAVQDALAGYQGGPMTRISPQDVTASLGDVAQVKSVDVSFHPPHTISVQLHERVGVAVVEDGTGVVLVDSEGKPLSTVPRAQRPDVPLIAGGRGVLSTQKFQDISDVLAALPADVLSRLEGAAAPSGSAVELTFKDGKKVRWGDAGDSELKAQVVAALVNSHKVDGATLIDVSAPLHPVVT